MVDEPTCTLCEYLCDRFPTDVPGERELTAPGQGALGKVGQDAELIFPALPQGHPELIHGWSRVCLAQAPPGPGIFLSRAVERSPGLPLPVSGVRVLGGLGLSLMRAPLPGSGVGAEGPEAPPQPCGAQKP